MTVEKIGDWTVKANKKTMKLDPANNKKERYQLTSCDYGWTYFDTVKKENIVFNPRQWRAHRKFETENKGNITTNF